MTIKTLTKSILLLAATIIFASTFAYAASADAPSAPPNPADNPMLAEFLKSGAKVYYLGNNSGLYGWFVAKDNAVQIAYTIPGSQNILIGVLFGPQDDNISSQQIKKLYQDNKEANAFLTNLNTMQSPPQMMQSPSLGMPPPQGDMMTAPVAASSPLMPPSPNSPGEQLMQALQNAAGVNVGAATAPKLYMIFDPDCPHCHETWQALRTAVFGGKLQIRLVPVDAFGAESARAGAQFLHVADPLNAWDKYVGGDKNQLAGNPDPAYLGAVHTNHVLADAWHIQVTPYMVYRAKDGQAKIVQGEPDHPETLIDDIGP